MAQRNPLPQQTGARVQRHGPLASSPQPRQGGSGPTLLTVQPGGQAGVGKVNLPHPAARHVVESQQPSKTAAQTVVAFLRDAGLQQHISVLLQNGFDDMETLQSIEDSDLRELGLPVYSIIKLRKRLQEANRKNCEDHVQQLDKSHPVVAFLMDINLEEYAELLLRHGFDDLETLAEMSKSDMQDLGIKRGHMIKLAKKLREFSEGSTPQATSAWGASGPGTMAEAARDGEFQAPRKARHEPRPSLSESTKETVQHSWLQVQERGTAAVAELMPQHLFELAPSAHRLFPPQVRERYRDWTAEEGAPESERSFFDSPGLRKIFIKIVNTTGQAVAGLHDLDQLIPMLRQLGARHVNYGVKEDHFPAMAKALNRSLHACLGEAFTQEAEYAWATTFSFISAIVIEGMRVGRRQHSAASAEEDGEKSMCSSSTRTEPEPTDEPVHSDKCRDEALQVQGRDLIGVPQDEQILCQLSGA